MLQGTIPHLPEDYLTQKLEPHQRRVLQLALDNQMPTDSPLMVAELDAVLEALGLSCVWGKVENGYAKVVAFLVDEEHLFKHIKVYAWDDLFVPLEVRQRRFTWVKTPDSLFIKVMAQAQALERSLGYQAEVLTEDHPEMEAVGFRVVEANEIWMIQRRHVMQAIQGNISIHPAALSMMHSADKRRVLARALAAGVLTNVHTMQPTMLSGGAGVVRAQHRAEQQLHMDLASRPIAEAWLRRTRRKTPCS
jgi:hypothetical protein